MDKVNYEWAKDIPCRNVIIYGYCKKQKDGCPFKHDDDTSDNDVNHNNITLETSSVTSAPPITNHVEIESPALLSTTPLGGNGPHVSTPNGISLSQLPSLTKKNISTLNNTSINSNNNQMNSRISNSPPPHTASPSFTKFNAKMSASFTPMSNNGSEHHSQHQPPNNVATHIPTLTNNLSNLSIDNNISHSPLPFKSDPNNIDLSMNNGPSNASILSSSPTFTLPSFPSQQQQSQSLSGCKLPSLPIVPPNNIIGTNPTTSVPTNGNAMTTASTTTITTNNNNDVSSTKLPISLQQQPQQQPLQLNFPSIYPPPHSILQYHLYFPETPDQLKISLKPNETTPDDLFIPNSLREQLVKQNMASLQMFPPGGPLPDLVQDYFGLVPLDFHEKKTDKDRYEGHKNSLFKVFSNIDGKLYVMRRIHDIKSNSIDPQHLSKKFQSWKKLQNVNIVALKDVFITTKFNDSSLCLIYDYYPKAISLYEAHFINFPLLPINQEYLWTYLIQLTNAIKTAHSLDLILGDLINWEKIIVTNRPAMIKISGIGANDIMSTTQNRTPTEINELKQLDFLKLAELLIKLSANVQPSNSNSNNTTTSPNNTTLPLSSSSTAGNSISSQNKSIHSTIHKEAVEIDQLQVDGSFKEVLRYLTDDTNKDKTVKELSILFIEQLYSNFNSLKKYDEFLTKTLATELENSRLFRLICKLNFIFGRIESRIDINWSESGEKFPIILFYDFVFHQIDELGKPTMDLTHVLRCLNKLDAGVAEKLVLVTPDEMNCIIISYKELKDLIESTFRSLTQTM